MTDNFDFREVTDDEKVDIVDSPTSQADSGSGDSSGNASGSAKS